MTDIGIAIVIIIFFLILAETLIKLLLSFVATKTVSAIYKKTDRNIFSKIFTKSFLFGLLSDLIAYIVFVIGKQIIAISRLESYVTFSVFLPTSMPYDDGSLTVIITEILVSMVCTFLFSYFKIMQKTDLSGKQMLISALIITFITAPYEFFIFIMF